jgi:hypothetical protein
VHGSFSVSLRLSISFGLQILWVFCLSVYLFVSFSASFTLCPSPRFISAFLIVLLSVSTYLSFSLLISVYLIVCCLSLPSYHSLFNICLPHCILCVCLHHYLVKYVCFYLLSFSLCLSTLLSVSFFLSFFSICLPCCRYICVLSVCLSVCLFLSFSVYHNVSLCIVCLFLSLSFSLGLSTYLTVCLSACRSELFSFFLFSPTRTKLRTSLFDQHLTD